MVDDRPIEPLPSSEPALIETTQDERMWAMLAHLLTLSGYLIPFGNIIAPLVVWLLKKDSSAFVDYHGKESLNFQISMFIYILVSIPIGIVTCGIGFVATVALTVALLIFAIIAGVQANSGQKYRYPLTIRMIQ